MVEHFLVPSAAQCEGVWLPGPRPGPGCAVNPFDPGMIRTSRSFIGTMPTICGHIPLHRGRSITRIADRGRISGCDTANAPTVGPFRGGSGSGLLRGIFLTTERHRPGQPEIARSASPAQGKRPGQAELFSAGIVRCCQEAGGGDDTSRCAWRTRGLLSTGSRPCHPRPVRGHRRYGDRSVPGGPHPMLHQQPSWARPTGGNEDRLPRTRGVTGHSGWGLPPAGRSRTDRILDISPREPIDFKSVNDRVAPLVVE
jgi:hypothetical protein